MFSADFTATLTVLSAMITPAVLILATGQLILTTSQRLARSIDRARKISQQFEDMALHQEKLVDEEKKDLLYNMLYQAARRSKKLQQAISTLYLALCIFVGTSVSIGLFEVFNILLLWVPVALGLTGTAFLFYATVLLIAETRIAFRSVDKEMGYMLTHYRKDLPLFPEKEYPLGSDKR
jgi:hypothetical protein